MSRTNWWKIPFKVFERQSIPARQTLRALVALWIVFPRLFSLGNSAFTSSQLGRACERRMRETGSEWGERAKNTFLPKMKAFKLTSTCHREVLNCCYFGKSTFSWLLKLDMKLKCQFDSAWASSSIRMYLEYKITLYLSTVFRVHL